ncbi:MAG TPA: ferritin-like domain-containing protein, partial [Acidobacteriaceae bacterium]|nr:ferritin-like domain-containing protein [Acidobacteriaceae bacterium]
MAAGAMAMGTGLLGGGLPAFGQDGDDSELTKGDIAILRFLNAVEQIEADLWTQYSELGGIQDNEVSGANGGNPIYTGALEILDGDMAQYIHDNTDDENSHVAFLKAYLESKGAEAVDLSRFANIPGSTATGST